MWILLNDSFLSIVEHTSSKKLLLVRARASGDIEKIFPHAEVETGTGTDYQYRAIIPRDLVQAEIAHRISLIDYPNFKSSVPTKWRHDAYMSVWHSLWSSFLGR